jgi:membrane-associated phospholipid phosphatase
MRRPCAARARVTGRCRRVLCRSVFGASLVALPASAQSAPPRALRWNPVLDVTVVAIGAAGAVVSEVIQAQIAPAGCRWCAVDALDARVRELLRWRDSATADTMSSLIGFVVTPIAAGGLDALAAGHDGVARYVGQDLVLIAEAGVIAADVTQLTKILVARERPFAYALSSEHKPTTAQSPDDNLSFFSGHTCVAFALAVSAGTVATMHGYRWAPAVWSVGLGAASTTGYLRIAADRHWLTDVLVGAAVGAAVGVFVPLVFHAASDDAARSSPISAARAQLPVVAIVW